VGRPTDDHHVCALDQLGVGLANGNDDYVSRQAQPFTDRLCDLVGVAVHRLVDHNSLHESLLLANAFPASVVRALFDDAPGDQLAGETHVVVALAR
jgi:hypothetical protein